MGGRNHNRNQSTQSTDVLAGIINSRDTCAPPIDYQTVDIMNPTKLDFLKLEKRKYLATCSQNRKRSLL